MYECKFKVKIFEVNEKKELTIFHLLNSLQQAAYEDSSQKFFSTHKLWEKGFFWALTRLYLEIDNLPRLNETYIVSTYSVNLNKFYAKRDFLVKNNNPPLLKATTLWSLVNIKERKIVPIPKEWIVMHEKKTDILKFPKNKPQKNITYKQENYYYTRKQDLDLNKHLNNATFALFALESIPKEIESKYQLASLDILFLKEFSQVHKKLSCKLKTDIPHTYVIIEDLQQTLLTAVTITWKI